MFKSTPAQMKDFLEGFVWADMKEEVEIWIKELQATLSDPDGPTDLNVISTMRGSIKACENFLLMPSVLIENMNEDKRHEENDKTKKNWR